MNLVAHETNFQIPGQPPNTFPGANGQPPALGDRFVIRDDLTENGTVVGYANVECTFTFNDNTLCTGAIALSGRGDIVAVELDRPGPNGPPQVFDAAITGGTFEFANARGDIHFTAISPTDTQLQIHLD